MCRSHQERSDTSSSLLDEAKENVFRAKTENNFSSGSNRTREDGYRTHEDDYKTCVRENFQNENKNTRLSMGDHVFPHKAVCTDGTNAEYFKTFRANGPFSQPAVLPEKEKENIPPLPRGFIRASDYPRDEDTFGFPQNGTNRQTSRFTSEERDTDQNFTQSEPTPSKMGQKFWLKRRKFRTASIKLK